MNGETLVAVTVGSRLFGTDRPDSDHDFIHVIRPTLSDRVLGRADSQPQQVSYLFDGTKCETTEWSVQHFFKLLGQGQTQALELVFAPRYCSGDTKRDFIARYWPEFREEFLGNPTKWLSKNTSAFVGYCRSQANKYSVKGGRLAAVQSLLCLLRPWFAKGRINRKLVEYPELLATLRTVKIPYLSMDMINSQGRDMEHINCCNVKCPVHFSLADATVMYERLANEYGQRARVAKDHGSIDWKALSHAARVTIEAKELLTDHFITLPLKESDRKYVKDVKAGRIAHEAVTEFLDAGLAEIEDLRANSSLPEKIDQSLYDSWVLRAYEGMTIKGKNKYFIT